MNKARLMAPGPKNSIFEDPSSAKGGVACNSFFELRRTKGRITIAEAVCAYQKHIQTLGYSSETIRSYSYLADVFFRMSGVKATSPVAYVTREHAERCMRNLSKFYQPQTAWTYSAKIIHLFRVFAVAGLIFEHPFGWVTRPSKPKLLPGMVLSLDQVNGLLGVPDVETKTGIRHRAILETLYSSAVRLSEAANLQLSDVDLDRGAIIVRQGKGAKDRVVPLGDKAAKWLKKYLLEVRSLYKGTSQAFWITHNGRPISAIGIRFIVKKAGRKAGIHVNPHTLRRSCATHLLQAGASPMMVKEILGHADLETLSRYLNLTLTELKHVHEQTHPRG